MAMRPIAKGFIAGGIALVVFYLIILAGFFLIGEGSLPFGGSVIGVVEIRGLISDARPIIDRLIEFRDTAKIKGVILRIDSQGGSVGPTQEIYTEVRRTIAKKPVVASLGGTCASGGYYIAAACSRIVANPGTLTGSIGVLMEFINVEGLLEWVGLRSMVVKSGEFKDLGSYTRRITPKENKLLQEVVDDVHKQFVEAICVGRNLPEQEVSQFADGRLFTGAQAMQLKLVDELGNFEDAVRITAEMAGLEDTPDVYWPKRRKLNYLELFLDDFSTRLAQGVLSRLIGTEANLMYR